MESPYVVSILWAQRCYYPAQTRREQALGMCSHPRGTRNRRRKFTLLLLLLKIFVGSSIKLIFVNQMNVYEAKSFRLSSSFLIICNDGIELTIHYKTNNTAKTFHIHYWAPWNQQLIILNPFLHSNVIVRIILCQYWTRYYIYWQ